MIKFLKKLFKNKPSDDEKKEDQNFQDLTDSDIIEAVTVMLLRAANIDGNKDEKEIILIKKIT